jgi:glutathione S-transferase
MVTPKTRPTKTDPGMTHEEFLFNCAQRGHGNYLENQSTFLPALLVVGVQYPLTCSVSGAVWIVSRAVYAVGYTKPEWGNMGTGRFRGALHYFPPLVIYGLAVYSGVKMILS